MNSATALHLETPPTPDVTAGLHEVERLLGFYREKLARHPILGLIQAGTLSPELTREFAALQYIDSIVWVPMLAMMKDKVKSKRLQRALRENVLCEAGANGTSHITLCRKFIESIGVPSHFGDYKRYSELATHPMEVMNGIVGMSEAEIGGWILAAEDLVPTLFTLFRPALDALGADLQYIDEHIHVDADDHAKWMREGIAEILAAGTPLEEVLHGIDVGARAALSEPDALYAKALRLREAERTLSGPRACVQSKHAEPKGSPA